MLINIDELIKIDVHQQVMMNIDIIAKMLMEEINGTES